MDLNIRGGGGRGHYCVAQEEKRRTQAKKKSITAGLTKQRGGRYERVERGDLLGRTLA
jgi:hypothetical protein